MKQRPRIESQLGEPKKLADVLGFLFRKKTDFLLCRFGRPHSYQKTDQGDVEHPEDCLDY